jgi:CubicO group peptidase (beta-lactamase class C family)
MNSIGRGRNFLNRTATLAAAFGLLVVFLGAGIQARAREGENEIAGRLQGLDGYIKKALKDWNAPGLGIGIVVDDRLVFARGYGYRDYEKKLPFTPGTLCPIGSNSKLFTAVASGLLVDEGRLTWDEPIRDLVPEIRFYNDELNNTVTLRDMLAHRTGITRHDMIWYKSDFTRRELFDRLKYLEPRESLRETFLYNNMMYAAVGYIIELKTGKTWEEFVRERIFKPLDMENTVYAIHDMIQQADHGVPFTEKRDSREIYRIPYNEDTAGIAPAGAIISSIRDMSHWLTALMNEGRYSGRNVLPPDVLKATMEPAFALPNTLAEARGFWELLNSAYGMGRFTASYRGRLLTYHGGSIDGFHSQVSFMPREKIGVVVLVIGDHCASLSDIISYNAYERLLGIDQTPWSSRLLELNNKGKEAGREVRSRAGMDRVPGTRPSHEPADYAGIYEHPAYGLIKIALEKGQLLFGFHDFNLPLSHFHYDRFDTPDDEQKGKWSVNFLTSPQGDIDRAVMSLDEAEVAFARRPEPLDINIMKKIAGTYETPTGFKFQVILKENEGCLYLVTTGNAVEKLIHYKDLKFRIKQFSDQLFEFIMENGRVKGLKHTSPAGEYVYPRK